MGRPGADQDTLQKVRQVLSAAMEKGRDPAEALDRAGLLVHPALLTYVTQETLGKIAEVLDDIKVSQLASVIGQRMPTSPLDTKRQIAEWIRQTSQVEP